MSFFSPEPHGIRLTEFDAMHVAAILFLGAAIVLSAVFRNRLKKWQYEKHFRIIITIIAIVSEIMFQLWRVFSFGGTLLRSYLPFDLCTITLYLCWALMFTKKEWLAKLIYFFSTGALAAMFVPDLGGFGINHFRYYHFFFTHGYIVFTALYFVFVHDMRITLKNYGTSTLAIVALAAFTMWFNYIADTNYMYLMRKPAVVSPLDLLGEWPQYVYGLVGIALGVFAAVYIPWIFINKTLLRKVYDK